MRPVGSVEPELEENGRETIDVLEGSCPGRHRGGYLSDWDAVRKTERNMAHRLRGATPEINQRPGFAWSQTLRLTPPKRRRYREFRIWLDHAVRTRRPTADWITWPTFRRCCSANELAPQDSAAAVFPLPAAMCGEVDVEDRALSVPFRT